MVAEMAVVEVEVEAMVAVAAVAVAAVVAVAGEGEPGFMWLRGAKGMSPHSGGCIPATRGARLPLAGQAPHLRDATAPPSLGTACFPHRDWSLATGPFRNSRLLPLATHLEKIQEVS